jgi:hypothetical protein
MEGHVEGDPEATRRSAEESVYGSMVPMLMAMATCQKPTFAVVR